MKGNSGKDEKRLAVFRYSLSKNLYNKKVAQKSLPQRGRGTACGG